MTPVSRELAEAVASEQFGLAASARNLPGEFDRNFVLTTSGGEGYILKFSHPQTADQQLDFENALMEHLASSPVSHVVPRIVLTVHGSPVARMPGGLRARLQTRLPGRMLVDVRPYSGNLLREIGAILGELDFALENFFHPAMHREWMWDLTKAAEIIRPNLEGVNPAVREDVAYYLARFETEVLPKLNALPAQVVHNDANDHNLLVHAREEEGWKVSGLVDFGDSLFAPRVCELAIAAAYTILEAPDPLSAAGELAAGYHSVNPLSEGEFEVLWDLVGTRLAASISIAAKRAHSGSNNTYHQVTADAARETLNRIRRIAPMEACEKIRRFAA